MVRAANNLHSAQAATWEQVAATKATSDPLIQELRAASWHASQVERFCALGIRSTEGCASLVGKCDRAKDSALSLKHLREQGACYSRSGTRKHRRRRCAH